jgi:hypothetical protein
VNNRRRRFRNVVIIRERGVYSSYTYPLGRRRSTVRLGDTLQHARARVSARARSRCAHQLSCARPGSPTERADTRTLFAVVVHHRPAGRRRFSLTADRWHRARVHQHAHGHGGSAAGLMCPSRDDPPQYVKTNEAGLPLSRTARGPSHSIGKRTINSAPVTPFLSLASTDPP